jgi:hypothetical protein
MIPLLSYSIGLVCELRSKSWQAGLWAASGESQSGLGRAMWFLSPSTWLATDQRDHLPLMEVQ